MFLLQCKYDKQNLAEATNKLLLKNDITLFECSRIHTLLILPAVTWKKKILEFSVENVHYDRNLGYF